MESAFTPYFPRTLYRILAYTTLMETTVIAVGGADCGFSPVLPYIGKRISGELFTRAAKAYLEAVLLRCGFDVLDIPATVTEPQDAIMRINRYGADGAVIMMLSAFGSRKSFNETFGARVRYSKPRGTRSRVLCEDICSRIELIKPATVEEGDPIWQAATCPTAVVCAGYLTHFDEAKRSLDPDCVRDTCEHVAMGVCEHYGYPYVTDCPFPLAAGAGKRGKKVQLVQALLATNGYELETDGIFGKATADAFSDFCERARMDGTDDEALYRALTLGEIPHEITLGARLPVVRYIQRKLYAKLYDCPQSGELCADTVSAINEFLEETNNALRVENGIVTESIIKALSVTGGGRPRLF